MGGEKKSSGIKPGDLESHSVGLPQSNQRLYTACTTHKLKVSKVGLPETLLETVSELSSPLCKIILNYLIMFLLQSQGKPPLS
jgi:hypothetical protein